jgi:hypothetical protein
MATLRRALLVAAGCGAASAKSEVSTASPCDPLALHIIQTTKWYGAMARFGMVVANRALLVVAGGRVDLELEALCAPLTP